MVRNPHKRTRNDDNFHLEDLVGDPDDNYGFAARVCLCLSLIALAIASVPFLLP